MNTILDQIVADTRARLLAMNEHNAPKSLSPPRRSFRRALASPEISVIAEVKAASPSAGTIVENPPVEHIALEYSVGGAAAVSVVTESAHFHGSRDWLQRASEASGLPVLMKDFIVDRRQVAEDADAVLLIVAILTDRELRELIQFVEDSGRDALVEVHDEAELLRALDAGASIVGVNNRDLHTFAVSLETSARLARQIPRDVIAVSESGIRTREDVMRMQEYGFRGVLVGEALLRASDRTAAVGALLEDA